MPLNNYAPAASVRQDYGKTVADVVALRAVTITERFAGQMIMVDAKDTMYELEESSGGVDDGDLIIKPTDEVGAARWEKRFTIATAPAAHAIGGTEHTPSTLAAFNTKLSDATLQISAGRVVRTSPTDDLEALLGAASDGDYFILEKGDHDVTGAITVNNARITLDLSHGAKIKSTSSLANIFVLGTGADDFHIFGGEIECGATVNMAIKITAPINRCIIYEVHFTKLGTTGAGPAIEVNTGTAVLDDWTIKNCFFDMDNFKHGIEVAAQDITMNRWEINNNRFITTSPETGALAINIAATSTGLVDSKIQDNTIDKADSDGIFVANGIRCNFDRNHIRNCGDDGMQLTNVTESKAHDNHCSGNTGLGINETGTSNFNVFDGNHLRGNTGGAIALVGTNSVEQGTIS